MVPCWFPRPAPSNSAVLPHGKLDYARRKSAGRGTSHSQANDPARLSLIGCRPPTAPCADELLHREIWRRSAMTPRCIRVAFVLAFIPSAVDAPAQTAPPAPGLVSPA